MTANNWFKIGEIIVYDRQILKLVNHIMFNQQKGILTAIVHSPCGTSKQFVLFIEEGEHESNPTGVHFTTGITLENFLLFLNFIEEEIGEKFLGNPEANKEGTKEWHRSQHAKAVPNKDILPLPLDPDADADDDATPGSFLNKPIAE